MTPERWRRITRIFHGAFAADAATRDAFLADACQDDAALRAEVDALLAAHQEAGSFGDLPAVATAGLETRIFSRRSLARRDSVPAGARGAGRISASHWRG